MAHHALRPEDLDAALCLLLQLFKHFCAHHRQAVALVVNPLVDLVPLQACACANLTPHLLRDGAAQLREKVFELLHLLFSLNCPSAGGL